MFKLSKIVQKDRKTNNSQPNVLIIVEKLKQMENSFILEG